MNIEDFRSYCLSLGEVEEKMPFGKFARRYDTTLVFYVCGHMFAMCDVDDFSWVNVRSSAEEITEIIERYPSVTRPINPALKLWIGVPVNNSISDDIVRKYVRRSYEIILLKYTKGKNV